MCLHVRRATAHTTCTTSVSVSGCATWRLGHATVFAFCVINLIRVGYSTLYAGRGRGRDPRVLGPRTDGTSRSDARRRGVRRRVVGMVVGSIATSDRDGPVDARRRGTSLRARGGARLGVGLRVRRGYALRHALVRVPHVTAPAPVRRAQPCAIYECPTVRYFPFGRRRSRPAPQAQSKPSTVHTRCSAGVQHGERSGKIESRTRW